MTRRLVPCLIAACLAPALGGCEQLGLEDPAKIAAIKEAEGRAIGGACRHSGRPLEDCYVMNPKAQKAAIYAGWRDMDTYMRDNNIQAVVPDLVDPPAGARAPEPAPPAPAGNQQAAPAPGRAG